MKPSQTNVKRPTWRSWVGLILAVALLWFAFRGIDAATLWEQVRYLDAVALSGLAALVLLSLFLRGWRWWYTLPEPRMPGEFWLAQKSLAMCYAVNSATPRLGEVLRTYYLGRRPNRSYAQIVGTIVLDRFLLDLAALCILMALSLAFNQQQLTALVPQAGQVFNLLMLLAVLGLAGILVLAIWPKWVLQVLNALGLKRIPAIQHKVAALVDELSRGMEIMKKPRHYLAILGMTLLIWATYILLFFAVLAIFEVPFTPVQGLLVYTISVIGFAIPTPGNVGAFHYITKLGLVSVLGVSEAKGLAIAIFIHGFNLAILMLAGLVAWRSRTKAEI